MSVNKEQKNKQQHKVKYRFKQFVILLFTCLLLRTLYTMRYIIKCNIQQPHIHGALYTLTNSNKQDTCKFTTYVFVQVLPGFLYA